MGIFSRTAQATYLLSEALKSVPPRVNYQDQTAHANQVMQLRRTLLALVHLADTEATVRRLEFCTPSSICFRRVIPLNVSIQGKQFKQPSNSLKAPFCCSNSMVGKYLALALVGLEKSLGMKLGLR